MVSSCIPEPVGLEMVHFEANGDGFGNGPFDVCFRDDLEDSPHNHVLAKLDSPPQGTSGRTRTRNRRTRQHNLLAGAENRDATCSKTEDTENRVPAAKHGRDAEPKASHAPEQADDDQDGPNEWPAGYTTVMLRNIPVRYTAEELIADFHECDFEGSFDFFYLPIDFHLKRNRGYSFINFRSAEQATKFVEIFHMRQLTRYQTKKILEVSPALTQGFEENVRRYARRDARRVHNKWFKPMIF